MAHGSRSLSAVRSVRLYCVCTPTNGLQPRSVAVVFACAIFHATVSEMATYSALPLRTTSSRERMTSSTGVRYSQMCT